MGRAIIFCHGRPSISIHRVVERLGCRHLDDVLGGDLNSSPGSVVAAGAGRLALDLDAQQAADLDVIANLHSLFNVAGQCVQKLDDGGLRVAYVMANEFDEVGTVHFGSL